MQIDKKYKDEIGEMVDSINEMSMKISQAEKRRQSLSPLSPTSCGRLLLQSPAGAKPLIYDESLDAEAKRGIEIILKEARRLTKMVEELLEFTRMQDGRFTLNVEKMDIVSELEDSIFTYRELFAPG